MKTSHILAIALAIGAALWLASGRFGGEPPASAGVATTEPGADEAAAVTKVRVAESSAKPYTVNLSLTGRTEASRSVALRVETAGQIDALAAKEGQYLTAGDVIARIAQDDRPERLAEAKALVEQRQIEFDASSKLAEQGWRAKTANAESKADTQFGTGGPRRDPARYRAHRHQRALRRRAQRTRHREVGDVVDDNMQIGTLYDLDPVLLVAYAQRARGRPAQARRHRPARA